jgi:hydrogenase maturation protease
MSAGPAVTVAGSGNWLLGHDRVGPRVLAMIDQRYSQQVEICDLGTSALALLDHLHGQDLLVIVDACVGYGASGDVLVMEPDLETTPGRGTSVHQIGPVEALVVASHLEPQALPKRTLLILVETGGLSEEKEQAACEQVVEVLDREIGRLANDRATDDPASARTEGREPWQNNQSCNVSRG